MKTVNEIKIQPGTKVFVRADLDVPLQDNQIVDDFRLQAILPTLKYLQQQQAHIIIAGHIGRPKGNPNPQLSTKHLQSYLEQHLNPAQFELLENLRFDPREETGDDSLAQELAGKADIYVNESFATSHRNHASITGIPKFLPGFAGLRLAQEIEVLSLLLNDCPRPLIAIVGGAKIESKKPVVQKFTQIADHVLIGGKIGLDWDETIPQNLHLPTDYAQDNLDIGPQTIQSFMDIIQTAKTVVWAGPLGMWEDPKYMQGSKSIADQIANSQAKWIIGGGDTISCIKHLNLLNRVDFASTGGSAMLEYLVKETLPGLEALNG
jgi:phosphoglycerate kinase